MHGINTTLFTALTEELDLPPESLHPHATFEDLGLDSLTLLELAVIFEERTGTDFTDLSADASLAEVSTRLDHASASGAQS